MGIDINPTGAPSSDAISATSAAVTNASTAGSIAALSNAYSNDASVSAAISAYMSLQYGTGQHKVVADVQGVSATAAAGIKVSGLSISVAAAAVYEIEGIMLHSISAAANAYGFLLSTSAATFTGAGWEWYGALSIAAQASTLSTTNDRFAVGHGNAASFGSVTFSAVAGTAGVAMFTRLKGVLATTNGGTVQIKARVSVTTAPINIMAGSYFKAYRIG